MSAIPLLTTLLLTWTINPSDTPQERTSSSQSETLALLQQGGNMMQQDEGSTRSIDNAISSYLDAKESKSIITPGDFTEWPLELKAGQVVIADARSDAFDPALEIVDSKGTVVEKNDDRYPGDQRPLLFWRAPAEGTYALRVRSYQNKSGGQAFLRFKVYDSFDLNTGQMSERWIESSNRLLLRIPMKKGQIKQIAFETPDGWYMRPALGRSLSPLGLPHIGLSRPLDPAIRDTIMAPVDGDYYVIADINLHERRKVRAATRDIMPSKLTSEAGVYTAKATTNTPSLWALSVKAGEILEIATPELGLSARLVIAEEPDIASFDLKKPETNPFFPIPPEKQKPDLGPAFVQLPGRARDPRLAVFAFKRDAKIWLASNGMGEKDKEFTLSVKPAARDFTSAQGLGNKLRIGNTDYWAFDAKVGDVMTFDFGASGFAQKLIVRNPELDDVMRADAMPDQHKIGWNMITETPGRYLVAMSSLGDGGGGDYSLSRKVYSPKEFGKDKPAEGDFADGQPQVWKFTAKPDQPLYVHWKSSARTYAVSIRDETGAPAGFGLTRVDDKNDYGILKVSKPTTFLIVLTPTEKNAQFSIELSDLPGYAKAK